jgi:hypothetical protein
MFGLCLALMLCATAAFADQRVEVELSGAGSRQEAIEKGFDKALSMEVSAMAPVSASRLEAVMGVLKGERDALVSGYGEVSTSERPLEDGTNATAAFLSMDVRINAARLKTRLRELGVMSTLSAPQPYVLRLSGVDPAETTGLGRLQELSGLRSVAAADEGVPVLSLSRGGAWYAALTSGEWSATRSGKSLDEAWLSVWKDFFMRPSRQSAQGQGLEVRVSGWLSSMGPMEFDRLMDTWDAEIDHKDLLGVEMDGPGMTGDWRIRTGSRPAFEQRLGDAARAQGLSVEIRQAEGRK